MCGWSRVGQQVGDRFLSHCRAWRLCLSCIPGERGRVDGRAVTSRRASPRGPRWSGMSAAGSTSDASGAQLTWTWSPGRSSGRSCSGPTWAMIVESSGAASESRTHRALEGEIGDGGAAPSRHRRSARPSRPERVPDAPSGSRDRPVRSWCHPAGPSVWCRAPRPRRSRGWRDRSVGPRQRLAWPMKLATNTVAGRS